jgi:hypothetical protein
MGVGSGGCGYGGGWALMAVHMGMREGKKELRDNY